MLNHPGRRTCFIDNRPSGVLVVEPTTSIGIDHSPLQLRRRPTQQTGAAAAATRDAGTAWGEIVRVDKAAMSQLVPSAAKLEELHEVLPLMTTVFEGPVWRQNKDGG